MTKISLNSQIWHSKRYLVAILTFLGYLTHSTRVNISMAVVAMMDKSLPDTFDWTNSEKGVILSSFFYGYLWTHLLGGYLAARYGGNKVFGLGILVTSIGAIITPPIAFAANVWGIVVIRVIQGLAAGLAFPSTLEIFSKWAPQNERSRMMSLAMSGVYFGTVVANMFSGTIAVNMGWPSIYYIYGGIGVVWYLVFLILVGESPETDRFISDEEKEYIISNRGKGYGNVKTPWKGLFTSLPVWAITAAHTSFTWGFYTLFTDLPSYLKKTLNFDLELTGYIAAIPYITVGISMIFTGLFTDWLKIKNYLTLSQIRKYFTSYSFLVQGLSLVIVGYVTDPIACVIIITISITMGAFSAAGFIVNPLDIAPQCASIILGISNTFATVSGIISPLLTGLIVSDYTFEQWRIVFYISAAVYAAGALLYWFLSSGELQKWAVVDNTNDDSENAEIPSETSPEVKKENVTEL